MPSLNNGINTPVFSLKTDTSGGIGEYLDLIPLIDWISDHGFTFLQILPVNDSGNDPSPYNLQSAFALNPLLIKWPGIFSSELNSLKSIDYDAVRELKKDCYKTLKYSQEELNAFTKKHPWVVAYAEAKEGKKSLVEQYTCYLQMREVKAHADKKGVKIIGDLPILVAPDSVDVALNPELFVTSLSAGAPPDMYSATGQNWGFPLYNWRVIEEKDFHWWKERLRYAEEFYHFIRIDHIVGFYRIWANPAGRGLEDGAFYPPNENEWINHGEKILIALMNSTKLEFIGEDLGTVPDAVRESLAKLGIAGTKVLRWERNWHGDRGLIPFEHYPANSLATVSTHDSTPLRLWWETSPDERYLWSAFEHWPPTEKLNDQQIAKLIKQSHHTNSRYTVNLLLEYLSAIPELRWEDPYDDLINIPGINSTSNWRWRMKPTIQQLGFSQELSQLIKNLLIN